MRRTRAFAAAAVAAALFLSGCGLSNGDDAGSAGSGDKISGEVKGEITFATLALKPTFDEYINGLIKNFEAAHPGTTVKWVDLPFQGAQEKITNDAQAGTLPDVVNLNPNFAQKLEKQGVFVDMDANAGDVKGSFVPGAWDAFKVPGQAGSYGLPWYLTSEITMYNKDLFTQAGLDPQTPPKTIDELLTQAQKLSAAGKGKFYGWHPALENSFVPNLAKLGVPLLNEDASKWTFNTPEAVQYVTRVRDLYKSRAIAPDWLTQDHAKETEAYSAGRVALFPSGPNFLKVVGQNAPAVAKATAVAPQIASADGTTNMSVMGLLVPKKSKNPATALEFAKFVSNAQNQLAFAKIVTILPSTADSLKDPYFTQVDAADPTSQARKISAEQIAKAKNLTPVQWDDRTKAAVIGKIQLAVKGDLDPKTALDQAVDEANKLLAR
ncbi:ABC transporter substrate-binding protein [Micromonospora auratinigra]|uniref:Carbohydrate ABC transporter substrate-binding protein, CUT1 family (TC 3.A.1.1.-) n=1 Tax=Micromonospora auratinigra TaxID=261654 RepID=A0A1A8ZEL3_9ACTN|nr:sugar ABC transporter substrate-binding protein [Micromonospora auratinigra]SBT42307.1 carbohydrate ABC transporter substrate-binding protein, CUT1 family (TC 3.A.1.1.-) [Micromonospora auratinigra]